MKRRDMGAEWLVRLVAEGDSMLDAGTIKCMSDQLGIRLGEGRLFCVAIQYADTTEAITDVSKLVELFEACVYAAKSLDHEAYCYIGPHLQIVMVVSERQVSRNKIVSKLYNSISRKITLPVNIGVGRVYESVEKLNYSRVEAFEALNDTVMHGPISYIDDIYVSRSITTHKHNREKGKILELFKSGDVARLKVTMTNLVENVRAESPVRIDQPYPTSIRRTVVELLVEIMHIAADAGVDVDKQLNHEDPYTKVLEMSDTPEILRWFFDVVEVMSRCVSEQYNKSDSNMLVLAKKRINEHLYDPELSLSLISDELDITSTYFSAFFIREVGVGFNEYITGLRIEKAKQLLSETNLKINTIASQCGFRSASYFIVVFRKLMGMSPGEYRNTTNQDEK